MEYGNARLHQRTEGTRRASDCRLPEQVANARQPQLESIYEHVPRSCFVPKSNHYHDGDNADDHDRQVGGEALTEIHDGLRERGHLLGAFHEVSKYFLKLWDHFDHQEARNAQGDNQHHNRVRHCALNLVLDLLSLFKKLGEPIQRLFKDTAGLTCLRHVNVKMVKNSRILRQRLRERRTPFHGDSHAEEGLLQCRILRLLCQNPETSHQREARVHQRGKLAGQHHEFLGLNTFFKKCRQLKTHITRKT